MEGDHYRADQDYRFAKANLDAQRYITEASVVQHRSDAAQQQAEYERQTEHLADLQVRLQEVTRQRDAAKANVDQWLKKIKDAEDKKKELTASVDLLNKQLTTVDMGRFSTNWILSQPMLDFVNPVIKIDQVVLNDLSIDMNYMNVPRVDRCQTCHRAIDTPGWESKAEAARLSQELQQKLDAYQIPSGKAQGNRGAHRAAQADSGRAERHAQSVAHASEARPVRRLGLAASAARIRLHGLPSRPGPRHRIRPRRPHAGQPEDGASLGGADVALGRLLPGAERFRRSATGATRRTSSSRRRCIRASTTRRAASSATPAQIAVDRGDDITKATQTVELYGCYACHKISNWRFTDLRKPGPDLDGIAEKTTPEWAFRWISEPHNFRSTTRMPSFFYQRNMVDPSVVPPQERAQNIKFQDAEIHAIVSVPLRQVDASRVAAARRRRRRRAASRSSTASAAWAATSTPSRSRTRRRARSASPSARISRSSATTASTSPASARRRTPAWIYNWVKNPKAYYADAPMPSLRLTDQEAADVTAYLLTLQKPAVHDSSRSARPIRRRCTIWPRAI